MNEKLNIINIAEAARIAKVPPATFYSKMNRVDNKFLSKDVTGLERNLVDVIKSKKYFEKVLSIETDDAWKVSLKAIIKTITSASNVIRGLIEEAKNNVPKTHKEERDGD